MGVCGLLGCSRHWLSFDRALLFMAVEIKTLMIFDSFIYLTFDKNIQKLNENYFKI